MATSALVAIPDERDSADAGEAGKNSLGAVLGVVSGRKLKKEAKGWSDQ